MPTLLLLASPAIAAAPEGDRHGYDYNFDGHMDYRVLSLSDENSSRFDVFIFDPATSKHVKNETLSGTIYPCPDPKTKMLNCLFTGGHSGALFTGEVYRWTGHDFEYAHSIRQGAVTICDEIHSIRVKVRMEEGKPRVFSHAWNHNERSMPDSALEAAQAAGFREQVDTWIEQASSR